MTQDTRLTASEFALFEHTWKIAELYEKLPVYNDQHLAAVHKALTSIQDLLLMRPEWRLMTGHTSRHATVTGDPQ